MCILDSGDRTVVDPHSEDMGADMAVVVVAEEAPVVTLVELVLLEMEDLQKMQPSLLDYLGCYLAGR